MVHDGVVLTIYCVREGSEYPFLTSTPDPFTWSAIGNTFHGTVGNLSHGYVSIAGCG